MAAALSWFASLSDSAGWTPGSAGSVPSRFSGYGAGLASSTPSYQPFRHTRIVRYNIEVAEFAIGIAFAGARRRLGCAEWSQGDCEISKPAAPHREFIQVDPRTLHLPPGRVSGADPVKLARQIGQHGRSIAGLPPPLVVRAKAGALQLIDGVTRATRVGKLLPGQQITVEVIENRPKLDLSRFPTVGDKLP
jgi:hypothetical protein